MNKMEELLNQLVKKQKAEEKKKNMIHCILGVILFLAAVAGAVYAVYRFVKPDYLEDYEDDIDDDFDYDDDFFDDDDDFEEDAEKAAEESLDDVDDTIE